MHELTAMARSSPQPSPDSGQTFLRDNAHEIHCGTNLGGGDGAGDLDEAEGAAVSRGGGGEGSFWGPSLPDATRKATSKAETAERLQVRALVST